MDSSAAAVLMMQQGYDCAGITMNLLQSSTASEEAAKVCAQLQIPHHTLDLQLEFSLQVIEPFVSGYTLGYTPNPCIACNRSLKFGLLLDWATQNGFDYLATGHYARISKRRLLKAADLEKDQSYVLYTLTPKQLAFLRLPLGDYKKDEIKQLALNLGLSSAQRPESQDICFIPKGDYAEFIETYLQGEGSMQIPKPGNIVNAEGTVVGRHEGIHHFTIGQRRGLGVPGTEPYYVVDINAATATVHIGTKDQQGSQSALVVDFNLLAPDLLTEGATVSAKHRYRGSEHPARVFWQSNDAATVVFDEVQSSLTKGQALVLYNGDRVLGGGSIAETS